MGYFNGYNGIYYIFVSMKELSIEEKAQAYDIALDKIKMLLGTGSSCSREVLEYVFPELKESEDNEDKWIREDCINYLNWEYQHCPFNKDKMKIKKCVAWLEKQGERKPNMLELCEIEHIEHGKFYYCIKDYYDAGNKIASKGDVIQALRGMSIMGLGVGANEYFIPVYKIIQKPASWSDDDKGNLLEVKCIIDEVWHNQYVRETIGHSCEELESLWHWLDNIWQRVEYPQPKQDSTDRFFEGFKKGEQSVIENYGKYGLCKLTEWSEEDKEMIDETLYFIKEYQQSNRCKDENGMQNSVSCAHWLKKLKSLRPQSTWKPSDEQMEYLAKAITTLGDEGDCKTALILNDLRFELKKLKEE